jgi:hypothetical protein
MSSVIGNPMYAAKPSSEGRISSGSNVFATVQTY